MSTRIHLESLHWNSPKQCPLEFTLMKCPLEFTQSLSTRIHPTKISTRIHPNIVHQNSEKVSIRIHPKCPLEFTPLCPLDFCNPLLMQAGARPCIFCPYFSQFYLNFILLRFGYTLDEFEKFTLSKIYPYLS